MPKTKQKELREAHLSYEEMSAVIPKIDRRISDLNSLDINSVNDRSDPRVRTLENKLDELMVGNWSQRFEFSYFTFLFISK